MMNFHSHCDKGDVRLYTPDGRGAHFRSDGSFKGFLDYE